MKLQKNFLFLNTKFITCQKKHLPTAYFIKTILEMNFNETEINVKTLMLLLV
jgi:hypothetical protein